MTGGFLRIAAENYTEERPLTVRSSHISFPSCCSRYFSIRPKWEPAVEQKKHHRIGINVLRGLSSASCLLFVHKLIAEWLLHMVTLPSILDIWLPQRAHPSYLFLLPRWFAQAMAATVNPYRPPECGLWMHKIEFHPSWTILQSDARLVWCAEFQNSPFKALKA